MIFAPWLAHTAPVWTPCICTDSAECIHLCSQESFLDLTDHCSSCLTACTAQADGLFIAGMPHWNLHCTGCQMLANELLTCTGAHADPSTLVFACKHTFFLQSSCLASINVHIIVACTMLPQIALHHTSFGTCCSQCVRKLCRPNMQFTRRLSVLALTGSDTPYLCTRQEHLMS